MSSEAIYILFKSLAYCFTTTLGFFMRYVPLHLVEKLLGTFVATIFYPGWSLNLSFEASWMLETVSILLSPYGPMLQFVLGGLCGGPRVLGMTIHLIPYHDFS